MPIPPPDATKGRGAVSAATPQRFGLAAREADGDWLDSRATLDGAPPPLRTTVTIEHPRTILSRNQSPDIPFDRSLNAYRGCEHGCIYCFARPTHAFHDLSPGLDFESRLFAKPSAPDLLRRELAKRGYTPAPIAMGTNTDPYQPIEGTWRITRAVLELCLECRHPVTITTKSDRVLRDLDLLAELAQRRLVSVALSVTSLDPHLSRLIEPRAAAPHRRIAALRHLAPLFREWLGHHFPDRAAKVMHIVRDMRGGRDNDPSFHTRMKPQGVWADLTRARFNKACARLGLGRTWASLDCSQFRPPERDGQMELF